MSQGIDIKIGASTKGLQAGFQSAIQQAKNFARGFKAEITGAFSSGMSAVIGAASVGAVTAFTHEVMEMASEIKNASERLQIGAESLQELQHAFGRTGADSEAVVEGIQTLMESIVEARNGNKDFTETFKALGVSMEALKTKAPDEVLMLIAGSATEAGDPAERLARILKVMGDDGAKMASGLNKGVDALKELRKQAVVLTEGELKTLDDAGSRLSNIWTRAKVTGAKVITKGLDGVNAAQESGVVQSALQSARSAVPAFDALAKSATAFYNVITKGEPRLLTDAEKEAAETEKRALAIKAAKIAAEEFNKATAAALPDAQALERAWFAIAEATEEAAQKAAVSAMEYEQAWQEIYETGEQEKEQKAQKARQQALNATLARQETAAVLAELAGQDAIAEEIRTKARYMAEIATAQDDGNLALAAELATQRDVTLELQKQTREKRIQDQKKAELKEKVDDKLAGPDARREARRQEGRRKRAENTIKSTEKAHQEAEERNGPSNFDELFGRDRAAKRQPRRNDPDEVMGPPMPPMRPEPLVPPRGGAPNGVREGGKDAATNQLFPPALVTTLTKIESALTGISGKVGVAR